MTTASPDCPLCATLPQKLMATLGPLDHPNERVPVSFVRGSFLLRFVLVKRLDNGRHIFVHDSQLRVEEKKP